MVDAFTTTAVMANLVQTAYDRFVAMKLRNVPVHRAIADVRPQQVPMPGSSIIMQIHGELAPTTTTLTEAVDPDAVALPNTTTVTITPGEYGQSSLITRRLGLYALSDVDPAAADQIAWHMVNSLDRVFRAPLVAGTNVAFGGAATSTVTVLPTHTITGPNVTDAVTLLRGRGAIPRRGEMFGCYIHPYVSRDLRLDTGNNNWRSPHQYSAPDAIWAGEIGEYEGAFYIETNRAFAANDGEPTGGATGVFRTLFFGKQFAAQAVWDEPHVVVGNIVDKLKRFRPLGWTGTLGVSRYRESCGQRLETAAALTGRSAVPSDQPA